MKRRSPGAAVAALLAFLVAAPGCVTREVNDRVYQHKGIEVYLRDYRKGFVPVGRDFQHPLRISSQRLANILSAIEVRGREEDLVGLQAAFDPENVRDVAEALAYGLAEASPSQEIAVQAVRKQMQKLIFDRKYLTSFVAYVQDDLLYLHLSRVDWKIPTRKTKSGLPMPRVNEHPMRFKVEPWEGMFQEGPYALAVDWQSPTFQRAPERADDEGRRERIILMEEPERAREPRPSALPADLLPLLTPAQLRELADLEEARGAGSISEGAYRRQRDAILEAAREQSATSD